MSEKLSEEREEALRWFIKVLIACEGYASATDYRGNPLNVFCDDFQPLDTFNLAIERGFTRSTHDSDTDESRVYLTDAGRAFLNAARAEARPAPVVDRVQPWRIMTPEEYAALKLKGPHVVERDQDGFGAVAVWLGADAPLSPATSPGEGSSSANRAARIASDHAASETPRLAGRCATCRHFHPDRLGFGSCDRWKQGYGTSVEDLRRDEVLVENDEGWGMIVGPLFGCVLHGTPTPDDAGGGG